MRFIALLGLLTLALMACSGNSDTENTNTPVAKTPPVLENAATLSPVLIRLQHDYETLTAAHDAISDIWENLAANEPVRCGDNPDILSPENISRPDDVAFEPLADQLRRVAINLELALNLWKAECANPRSNPSPDVINEGRLAVRAAGDALDNAQMLLHDIQP